MTWRGGADTENRAPGLFRSQVPDSTPDTTALLRELIAHNYLEIGRADGKAAVLLATGGSLLSLLLVRRPAVAPWTQFLWWSAVLAAAGAVGALLLVLIPRRDSALRQGMRVLTYFEDVVQAQNQSRLSTVLEDSVRAPELRLLRALQGTSRIAHIKNRYVSWAVLLLLPALLTTLAALAPGS